MKTVRTNNSANFRFTISLVRIVRRCKVQFFCMLYHCIFHTYQAIVDICKMFFWFHALRPSYSTGKVQLVNVNCVEVTLMTSFRRIQQRFVEKTGNSFTTKNSLPLASTRGFWIAEPVVENLNFTLGRPSYWYRYRSKSASLPSEYKFQVSDTLKLERRDRASERTF